MVNRLERYRSETERWSTQKFNVLSKFNLEYIKLHVSLGNLKSFEDVNIIHTLSLLEKITGQKGFVKNYESKYVGSTRKFSITCVVTLRKEKMYNFLDYLVMVVFPQEARRYGRYNLNKGKLGFVVGLKDWATLYGYRGEELNGVLNIELKSDKKDFFVNYLNLFKVPVDEKR